MLFDHSGAEFPLVEIFIFFYGQESIIVSFKDYLGMVGLGMANR